MNIKLSILTICTALFFYSCKNEKETPLEEKDEAKNEFFSVEMNLKVKKEDNFCVYYTEDSTINFNGDKTVWSGVKGQEGSQKVYFRFSEDIIPTNIRFDFGLNKDQEDIILENFKIEYFGNFIEVKGSDFFKYFIVNESIKTEIDEVNGTIKFLKSENTFSTPFYYPHQLLLDEISKITK